MNTKISNWKCLLDKNVIRVFYKKRHLGNYDILQEPYCHRCSMSEVTEDECSWHWNLDTSLTRIYAVGEYLSGDKTNLLKKHLNELKTYKFYSFPIGYAITLLINHFHKELTKTDFIIPVPIHEKSLNVRTFNQAEEIAKVISTELKIPFINPLIKIKDVKMHYLPRTSRVEFSKGIYSCMKNLTGSSILLIDDTSTSGSTLSECSKVLHENGATKINAMVGGKTKLRFRKN